MKLTLRWIALTRRGSAGAKDECQLALEKAMETQRSAKEDMVKIANEMWFIKRLIDMTQKDYKELENKPLLPNGRPRTKAQNIA